jgi:(p)ppGpp synthase/HD superfamily hydrolase
MEMLSNINQNQTNPETVTIKITAKDRTGLVHEIAGIIAQLHIPILHHEAKVYNNKNKGMISESAIGIQTDNKNQLDALIRKLKKMKGIISVY